MSTRTRPQQGSTPSTRRFAKPARPRRGASAPARGVPAASTSRGASRRSPARRRPSRRSPAWSGQEGRERRLEGREGGRGVAMPTAAAGLANREPRQVDVDAQARRRRPRDRRVCPAARHHRRPDPLRDAPANATDRSSGTTGIGANAGGTSASDRSATPSSIDPPASSLGGSSSAAGRRWPASSCLAARRRRPATGCELAGGWLLGRASAGGQENG